MVPLRNVAFFTPARALFRSGQLHHLVGRVDAVHMAVESHVARGEDNVQASAAAQVEDDVAATKLGKKHRIPAAEAHRGGEPYRLQLSRRIGTTAAAVRPVCPAAAWGEFGSGARKHRQLPGRVSIPGPHRFSELTQMFPSRTPSMIVNVRWTGGDDGASGQRAG